jgi:2',3'-cyclic-nucleotide 2'-phosphodiesterase / 3'-nucleotidase
MKKMIVHSSRFKLSVTIILLILMFVQLEAQTIKLKIIQTTDEHGAIFPYDFTDMKEIKSSLAQISTYLKDERSKNDQEVVVLSGGDILQGTPAVYYFNYEKIKVRHLYADVMNYMKYDAGAVGNHDIETGHAVYDRFKKQINFPWLAANAVEIKSGKPYFTPYTIIKRNKLRIAILGLITPHIPNWLPTQLWKGIKWEDMIASAQKWIRIIKQKEKPDMIIGLFHSGVDPTYGDQKADETLNENASRLVAEQVPGFDVVFVGHDHHGWNTRVTNVEGKTVNILGGTSGARDAAVANFTLTYDPISKKWNKEIIGEIVESKNYLPDNEFLLKFQEQFDEVKNYVQRSIGTFTKTLTSRDALYGPSEFTDLINQVQLELTKADISFTASLSMTASIDEGKVEVGKMFKLYRYENFLYTVELTGKEIKDYLEFTAKIWFCQMKSENDHLLNFATDENGNIKIEQRSGFPLLKYQSYNFDCAAGINYILDVSKPAGERITILSLSSGQSFDQNKKYKVAINSYRGNGGGGHLIQGVGLSKEELNKRIITSTDKDLRYYMMKWIEKRKTVTPQLIGNWKVIPEEWWLKGKEKDKGSNSK